MIDIQKQEDMIARWMLKEFPRVDYMVIMIGKLIIRFSAN